MSARCAKAGVRAFLFALAAGLLVWTSLFAFGGKEHIVQYSVHVAHKFTARAMLEGTLRMDRGLSTVTMNDEQVHNGAGFTNWGFGVPLLQLPFHALSALFGGAARTRFFPDRLIFFAYLVGLIPLLWTALQRATVVPSSRASPLSTWFLSWSATLLVLTYGLYDLLSYRFLVYEETLAYFVVAELYAMSFYVHFLESKRAGWLCGLAMAAGIGLLIRPTGLAYLGLWAALVLVKDRGGRTLGVFAAGVAPLVAFWLYSNWVKGGSPLTFGYQNGLPEYPYHYAMIRFGSQCTTTAHGIWEVAKCLFESFFLKLPNLTPELQQCHFAFEERLGNAPFFPPAVLFFLCASLLYHVTRRRWRLDVYLPHAAALLLFCAYVQAGMGFAWRYAGDFWPLIFLVGVQLAPSVRSNRRGVLRHGLALAFVFYSVVAIVQEVEPALPSILAYDAAKMAEVDADVRSRVTAEQPTLPSRLACGEPVPAWPRANGAGWGPRCDVDTVTNVYLGVRKKSDRFYTLRFKADRPLGDSLRVYVNGKYYTARLQAGAEYSTELTLDYKALYSPAVMVTVEWTRTLAPPGTRLLVIELA